MSLETLFGREHNIFQETGGHATRLMIRSCPVLSEGKYPGSCWSWRSAGSRARATFSLNYRPG